MSEIHAHTDSQGHSYLVDGETVYVTVKGTSQTFPHTREEARQMWADSARFTWAQSRPVDVERGRILLHGS